MENKNNNQLLGAGSLLITTFLYGFFGVVVKLIGFKIPLFYASAIRNLPMILILGFWVLISKNWTKITWNDFKWIFLRTFFGLLGFVGSYFSVYNIPIGLMLFVYFAGSTFGGYLIGKIIFNEKITLIKIVSLIVAIIGLILIYSSNFEKVKIFYVWISLFSGICGSVWNSFSKKTSHVYSITQLNFLDTVIFVTMMIVVSLFIKEKWILPEFSSAWFYLLVFGLVFIPTGQLIIYGYKHLNVHLATMIMLMEILFGAIFGFLFFHETLGILTLLGGGLIIFAIILPEINPPSLKLRKGKPKYE